MKNPFYATATLIFLTTAAVGQTDWKAQTLENMTGYPRILDASWSEAESLWLFANPADISWETVTQGFVCMQMNAAGKPAGEPVLVSWFDNTAALKGEANRIAQFWCE